MVNFSDQYTQGWYIYKNKLPEMKKNHRTEINSSYLLITFWLIAVMICCTIISRLCNAASRSPAAGVMRKMPWNFITKSIRVIMSMLPTLLQPWCRSTQNVSVLMYRWVLLVIHCLNDSVSFTLAEQPIQSHRN